MRITISFLLLFLSFQLMATHNRAGEITYEQIGDLTITATIVTYTKASSIPADRDSLEMCWGDGVCEWLIRVNGPIDAAGIPQGELLPFDSKKNLYSGSHTYSALGDYTISMTDPNRNGGIVNVNPPASDNVPFYLQNEFTLLSESNSSPVPLEAPIDLGVAGQIYYHTPNAYDADGDSLAYRMITPFSGVGMPVENYLPITEFTTGSNIVNFDEATGLLTWDVPQLSGEYVVTIEILSYRDGIQIGSMIRDMQILIDNFNNELPEFELTQFMPNELTTVEVGDTIEFSVFAEDTENENDLPLTVTSGLFDENFSSPPVFTIDNQNSTNTEATFSWVVSADNIREQPYQVVFKAVDDLGLAHIIVLRFKVAGMLTDVTTILEQHSVGLYPNPCQDFLLVDSDNMNGVNYEIFNQVGQYIRNGKISTDGYVDIEGIRIGVYVVRFEDGHVAKFVRE